MFFIVFFLVFAHGELKGIFWREIYKVEIKRKKENG